MNDRDEMASAPTGESASMGSSPSGPTSAKHSDSDQRVASQISATLPPSIPDYELLRRIGGGSYGEVWLARSATGVLRAVKIVWRHTFEDDRPFQREFEGIQSFERLSREHPSQLALFHVGRGEGYFFYVMELADAVENPKLEIRNPKQIRSPNAETPTAEQEVRASNFGLPSDFGIRHSSLYSPHTLRSDLEHGRLPAARVLEIALPLSEALAHLHDHGLVHRDIKPSNIIFVGGRPKLADIGLVTDAGDARSIVGTEGYLAPEGPGTPQADLFALGKVLYEAATGLDRRQFPQLPPDLREWSDAALVFELNEILLRACSPEPRQRYQTTAEIHDELALLQHGQSVKRKRAVARWWKLTKRIVVVASVVSLVVAGAMFGLRQSSRNRPLSRDPEAVTLYADAGILLKLSTLDATLEAITKLTEAVKRDPEFFDAYYRLFEAFVTDWGDQLPPNKNSMANIKWVTDKLRSLNPNSAQYHTVNAWMEEEQWHFDKAISEADLARKLDQQFLRAHTFYGHYMLLFRGDPVTARKEFEAAQKIDQTDMITRGCLANPYYFEGNFSKAIELWEEALRLQPIGMSSHGWLGQGYEADKEYGKALDHHEAYEKAWKGQVAETEAKYNRYRSILAESGRPQPVWRAMLDDLRQNPSPDHYYDMARLCARLGKTNEVFELLEKGRQAHNGYMEFLLIDDCWDTLRDDPRFDDFLERMGFAKVRPRRK